MKLDADHRLLLSADARFASYAPPCGWRAALPAIAAAVLAILAVYSETAKSIVAIWRSSDTFAHGFLIVPISALLVWIKRREVAALAPRPDVLGLALLGGAGFVWLVAEEAQVQVLAQYALVAMVPATVVALAGRRVAWALAFPLGVLLLAVPFGEAFLPRLMEWTADFTVAALRMTGIPVYREGTFFTIPSGHWAVAEACSGLRYLIASVTVGAVYAYLTYRTWWKRALFLALSTVVPIGANFVRAYVIVLVGHLSSMKLAVGVDHLIYGWVFFGLVIGLLFWLGSFWREPAAATAPGHAVHPAPPARAPVFAVAAAGTVLLAAAWPLCVPYLDRTDPAPVRLTAPAAASGWVLEPHKDMHWQPHYPGAAASTLAVYRKGEKSVAVYLGYYRNQHQGAELVGSQNLIAGATPSPWSRIGESMDTVELPNGKVELRQTRLGSAAGRILVWDWYRIGERDLSNPYVAKALLARDKLLRRADDSVAIVLAAPYEARPQAAAETLRVFAREMLPAIDHALRVAAQKESR